MVHVLEMLMVVSFGFAWPTSILKSHRARTTKGKSLFFLLIVLFGYSCGIASKFLSGKINYVVIFYIVNWIMVLIDTLLYFRNRHLDRQAEAEEAQP